MRLKIILLVLFLLLATTLNALQSVEAVFTRGLSYYIQREFKKAALEWKKLLDRNPNHSRAKIYMEKAFTKYNNMEINFYKGLDLFNKEKHREAIPFYQRTLMINPRHLKAIYYLELCYRMLKQDLNKEEVAREAINDADRFLEEEEFTKAIALYKIALLLEPDNYEAKMKLIQAQEKEIEANQNLELLMRLQAAREYHDKNEYLFAVQEWSKALLLDPENLEAREGLQIDQGLLRQSQLQEKIYEMISKGIDFFLNKEYYQAKDVFNQVLELDNNNEVALEYLSKIKDVLNILKQKKLQIDEAEKHFILGVDFFNKKKYENALEEFDFTLSLIPAYQEALDYRKRTLKMLRILSEKEAAKNNKLIQELLLQGIQFYQMSDFENAIYNFKKVLELEHNEYAKEYLRLSEEALRLQKQSVLNEDSPYYPIIKNLELKGKENLQKKNYNISMRYFKEIKELFPLNKEANIYILKIMYFTEPEKVQAIIKRHFENGVKFYKGKKYQRALYEFDLINNIDPGYPRLKKYLNLARRPPSVYNKMIKKHFNKGLLSFSKKQYKKAIEEWRRAVELDKSPLTNKYLAKSLANIAKAKFRLDALSGKTTDLKVSFKSREKLKKINKHYYMGVAYYTSGNYNKALKEWEAVLKLNSNHLLALKNLEKVKKRLKLSE